MQFLSISDRAFQVVGVVLSGLALVALGVAVWLGGQSIIGGIAAIIALIFLPFGLPLMVPGMGEVLKTAVIILGQDP
ncbi:MAG: hypothetical protein NTV48_00220 [Candidatus Vogelbacteria bacterium]|nr:hypothetical protein [Candidatus Vogelbacteria bacterium]